MTTASQHQGGQAPAEHAFDLGAYLGRIGLDPASAAPGAAAPGADAPGLETLRAVQRAHVMAVPFENLEPLRGTVPALGLEEVQDKLVRRRRGGYCFEQNVLLAGALEALGFSVRRLLGRVVLGAERTDSRARTHMVLLVDVPGHADPFLADVGFGGLGALLEPMPLNVAAEHRALGRRHRLVHSRPEGHVLDLWLLQAYGAEGWVGQYAFTEEPVAPVDVEVANWYVATHPRSLFKNRLTVQRTTGGEHRSLMGGAEDEEAVLTLTREDGTEEVRTLTADEVRVALVTEMGLPGSV